jgi:O-antigen/teichoic acid export membrane protein
VELASLRRWLILICGPAMLCLCAFSHELYVFAVETEYHSGHALVGLIMLGSVLGNLYMFTPGLDIARRTWTITAVNLAALCVNFTLNALLLKPFGVIGAGLAFCAGGLAMCIGYERLGHAHYPVASSHPELAYLILPTLLMTSLVYSAPGGTAAPIAVRAVALAALLVAMYAWARSRLGVRRGINAGISVE